MVILTRTEDCVPNISPPALAISVLDLLTSFIMHLALEGGVWRWPSESHFQWWKQKIML